MKKQLIKLLNPLLKKLGLHLSRAKEQEKSNTLNNILINIVKQMPQAEKGSDDKLSFVVFSKDRTLQLHALLASMQHHISGNYTIEILYNSSTDAHQRAYLELIKEYVELPHISWQEEQGFKSALVETLTRVKTDRVCFLVDDIIFIRPVDLSELNSPKIRSGLLSLRLGNNVTFCYTHQKKLSLPRLTPVENQSKLQQFLWQTGNYDWSYPLSLDGHIFRTKDILVASTQLEYRAPNTFEGALQILNSVYSALDGFCYEAPRIINIPINKVQTENDNISGNISVQYLLEKWQLGVRIDFLKLENAKTIGVHEELELSFYNINTTS